MVCLLYMLFVTFRSPKNIFPWFFKGLHVTFHASSWKTYFNSSAAMNKYSIAQQSVFMAQITLKTSCRLLLAPSKEGLGWVGGGSDLDKAWANLKNKTRLGYFSASPIQCITFQPEQINPALLSEEINSGSTCQLHTCVKQNVSLKSRGLAFVTKWMCILVLCKFKRGAPKFQFYTPPNHPNGQFPTFSTATASSLQVAFPGI